MIIKNPLTRLNAYKEGNEPTPAFREYIRIVKSLRLLDRAQHAAAANGKTLSKAMHKYKLLKSICDRKSKNFKFTARTTQGKDKLKNPAVGTDTSQGAQSLSIVATSLKEVGELFSNKDGEKPE